MGANFVYIRIAYDCIYDTETSSMDGQTKVPYSQLLVDLNKSQISVTEASEYVDLTVQMMTLMIHGMKMEHQWNATAGETGEPGENCSCATLSTTNPTCGHVESNLGCLGLNELKRSLDTQYLLVDKDVIHANDKLQIADQRQQLSIIGQQKLIYLKALLKDKKQGLKDKLASEVEKTNQWKKEILFIISKHESVFNERKAKYDMHPLAQRRWEYKNEYKQIDIMVNIHTMVLKDAKKKFYKLNQILEQMSILYTVQMAKAYTLCHQAMKRKLDLTAELRNQKQEVEELKKCKENIFIDGLKIKTHTTPQTHRSVNSKQAFDCLSQPATSTGTTGARAISPRITLDNIPRLQLPEWQGTPPKMPRLSSFTGTSYRFSSPLTKLITSTLSLLKSNPSGSVINMRDNILKGFAEKEQQSLEESRPSMKLSFTPSEKQNEMSVASSYSENVELFQSPMDTESNSNAKQLENTAHNQNSIHELEVQGLNVSREERIRNCNAELPVLNRSSESEHGSMVNVQESMAERDMQPTEPQDNVIPIQKWKKNSPEYHLKPFSISSATKINELVENIAEHEVPKDSEQSSTEAVAVSKDKDVQNKDDCMPCIPLISPTENSNSSGAALTGYDLSPNSYSGTDGYQSPNMDRWSPPNNLPEVADGSIQPQAAERMNIFGGTSSIPSNQAFSLAFDFGSSSMASSATTMLFGESEADKHTRGSLKEKDDGSNFSFGFQPIFKMF